jgi:hypothetical protein
MARNGAGTYTLPAGNPVTTGTTISSTWANNTLNDIASSLTASLAYDGQTSPVANLPMATYAHTGVGNATVRTMYASAGQVQDNTLAYLTSISGTDTITTIAPVSMNAYAAGQTFRFIAAGANTGAVTLNINSIGAKAITKNGTTALVANDILAGSVVIVTYDGTQFQLSNPATLPASVSSFTAGTTGFTPSTATTGAITLAGTLNVANGGTGATTLTSGSVIVGAGTSTPTFVAPTTTGNVLFTTNGTSWSSTAKIISGTAVASTSGTIITFTSIPSWVKRITFMITALSTSGSSNLILRIGGGSVESTGYAGTQVRFSNASNAYNSLSTSFILNDAVGSTNIIYGSAVLTLLSGNIWTFNGGSSTGSNGTCLCQGSKTTSTTLDRISLTTENGTDTFDAGSVNIIYE